ncbi:MAG: YbaK/EbsC family protein [Chloroflexi bacterium]|nr:YbaK/EbsC family protein [Chloroflexota bacterium]
MACKERLEAYLRENGIPYQEQHHAVAYTAQEIAAREHIHGKMLAKVVMVLVDDKMVMLVLPAPYRVDLKKTSASLGGKDARLADEKEFSSIFPDCELGAMPPFGNLYGLQVYVDKTLAEDETIVFQAGSHTETMSIKYSDFDRLVKPKLGEFAYHG